MFMKGFKKCSNLFMSCSKFFLNLYLLTFVWMIRFAFHIELGYHKRIHL